MPTRSTRRIVLGIVQRRHVGVHGPGAGRADLHGDAVRAVQTVRRAAVVNPLVSMLENQSTSHTTRGFRGA
jgi:hypothetical protein